MGACAARQVVDRVYDRQLGSSRGTHTMLVLAAISTIKMKREYPK